MPFISVRDCASDTPGFNFAITYNWRLVSSAAAFHNRASGTQTSGFFWSIPSHMAGKWNLGGRMPTMV